MSINERTPTFKEVARDLGQRAPDLARWLLGEPTSHNRHQFRYRNKGSLVVIVAGTEAGRWFDHDPQASSRQCESGDALNLIQYVQGVTPRDAYEQGLRFLGSAPAPVTQAKRDSQSPRDRVDRALQLWTEGRAIQNTIAEKYLRGRGITCALSNDLKFHPSCWNNEAQEHLPAMIALMRDISDDQNVACGVHRTWLAKDGSGKASVKTPKKMLGRSKNAVIKLTPDDEITHGLGLAEGIETGLSLLSANYHGIWVAGSAGAIRSFPILGGVEALTIFADNDESGTGLESARVCDSRWRHAGRECRIIYPRSAGFDWNDVVRNS